MSTCRLCGEPIEWVRTARGRAMPVDADSFGLHQLCHGMTVVTETGTVLRGGRQTRVTVQGYIPHWATCPYADQFRTHGATESPWRAAPSRGGDPCDTR